MATPELPLQQALPMPEGYGLGGKTKAVTVAIGRPPPLAPNLRGHVPEPSKGRWPVEKPLYLTTGL